MCVPFPEPTEPARGPTSSSATWTTSRAVVGSHDLAEAGQPGDRWDGADPPPLERILFHLLQEYARHLGQLDIVVELVTGAFGE